MMEKKRPHLSIIMPCYNVADTIDWAIQSILMQKVCFSYEIIAVDDASTDDTLRILEGYADSDVPLRVIRHEQNQGNAVSFYDALSESRGDYFCVLDGDDYYTLPDKLQKQVDFLDADTKQLYVGCCHYFVIDTGNGNVSVPDCMAFDEFNYTDFITQRAGYFHTATHMYRNIFRGNVPELYRQPVYRGDTPRTVFHTMFSGGKIKILPFVASVYSYTFTGIWSSLDQKKQFDYQVNYLNHLDKTVTSPTEHAYVNRLREINRAKGEQAGTDLRRYPEKSIEQCLARIHQYAKNYAWREVDYFLQHVYCSEYLDTLCATLGAIHRKYHPEEVQKTTVPNHLMIIIWQLNPHGGGLFREVEELLQMYSGWDIEVVVTDREFDISAAQERWADRSEVRVTKIPLDCTDTISFLSKEMCAFQPEKIYDYCSHIDVFTPAAIQPGAAKNICLFSYDHGYLVGLKNPFLDQIVAKRPVDYTLLTNSLDAEKIAYIPTWNILKPATYPEYAAFQNHENLITASGAARIYKLEGGWPYGYFQYIAALLKKTGGKHYHFGNIPDDKKAQIEALLDEEGVSRDQFVHIEWEENLALFCLEHNVDVFIEPFPTVSYKMTLDMLAAGIPVIAFNTVKRMERTDFLYPGAMYWKSKEQFIDILSNVTPEQLNAQSRAAKKYFAENHSFDVIKPLMLADRSLCVPDRENIADPNILDVQDQNRLFMDCCQIQIMSNTPIQIIPAATALREQAQKKAGTDAARQAAEERAAAERAAAARQQETANQRLYALAEAHRGTISYRIGYAIIYLPRRLKLFLRELPTQGLRGAWVYSRHPDAETTHMANPVLELEHVQNCTSMRVGKVVTAPFRAIRAFFSDRKRRGQEMAELLAAMTERMDALEAAMDRKLQSGTESVDCTLREIRRLSWKEKQILAQVESLVQSDEQTQQRLASLSQSDEQIQQRLEGLLRSDEHAQRRLEGLVQSDERVQQQLEGLERAHEDANKHLLERVDVEQNGIRKLSQTCDSVQRKMNFAERQLNELVWANVFHDTIVQSPWLLDKTFSPGNYAVGYSFLYVMYRMLDAVKPANILELGLGQSTRMIGQYAKTDTKIQHSIVEANQDWIDFIRSSLPLSENTKMLVLPYGMQEFNGVPDVRVFEGLKEAVGEEIFDFICIDAPIGENMTVYDRVDIFSLLPNHLNRRFVIMMDDVNRQIDANTAAFLDETLTKLGIPYQTRLYKGAKDIRLWCSPDLGFLCTL